MHLPVKAVIDARYAKAKERYEAVPEHIREDIGEAIVWAKQTLMEHEGAGHQFYVTAASGQANAGLVVASFAKPWWNADHCSQPMEHGAEAIVMAVCEYLSGC
jgi:hypothetical protein